METTIEVPKAFSVRDDNEFLAFKHLMARLNPQLRVRQVGMGLHVNSGYTVYWGLVSLEDQRVTPEEFHEALAEAGFDFGHTPAASSTRWWRRPRWTNSTLWSAKARLRFSQRLGYVRHLAFEFHGNEQLTFF